jgi:hypothetical protein
MIGALPNPKKTITIDFPISKLKQTIGFIPLTKDKTYKFTSKNEVFNLYTFEATEFLSLGVYVDISFSEVSENKTTIEIEVRRKIGAFDKSHEITSANNHISKIIELISLCVSLTDEKIEKMTNPVEHLNSSTNSNNANNFDNDTKAPKKMSTTKLVIIVLSLWSLVGLIALMLMAN